MYPRTKQLSKYIPFDVTNNVQILDLPRDGAVKGIRLALCGSFALSGGSASGTVKTTPLSPFGLIQRLVLRRGPESYAGPLVLDNASLLHMLAIPFFGRTPKRTAPADGSATTNAIYGEMYIPQSFLSTLDSLLPTAGRSTWQLEVTWPTSVGNARDALFASNDRTFANSATLPLRIEVTIDDVTGADVPAPDFEVALRYDKLTNPTTGLNEKVLSATVGERVPLIMLLVQDNSARADVLGAPNDEISLSYGGADPVIKRKAAQLAPENDGDYGIRDGDRLTGLYFIDETKRAEGDLMKVPPIASDGGQPKVSINTGSTAWTATAQVEFISFVVRLTAEGRRKVAAGEMAAAA